MNCGAIGNKYGDTEKKMHGDVSILYEGNGTIANCSMQMKFIGIPRVSVAGSRFE